MKKIFLILFLVLSINLYSEELETILNSFSKLVTMPNLTGEFSITLISNSGDKREIKAKAYQKLIENKQMNRLFSFSSPPSVRGTGLLIHSFLRWR
jgi:hypothetical protein